MDNTKKVIFAAVLFIFLGLTIYTFANPEEEEYLDENTQENVDNNYQYNDNYSNANTTVEEDNNEVTEPANEEVISEPSETDLIPSQSNTSSSTKSNKRQTNSNNSTKDTTYDDALEKVIEAENNNTKELYESALQLTNKVTDSSKKEKLVNRLNIVLESINAKELVNNLKDKTENAKNKQEMDEAREYRILEDIVNQVNNLSNGKIKEELTNELNELSLILDDDSFPEFNIPNASHFTENVNIIINDKTYDYTEIYNQDKEETTTTSENTFTLTEEATYRLRAYDKNGNKTELWLAIDITNPIIEEVNEYTNKNITIRITDKFLKEVKINNELQSDIVTVGPKNENREFIKEITEDGTYEVIAKDKAGNEAKVKFTIDKIAPIVIANKDENGNKDINVEAGNKYVELGATVIDNVDENRTLDAPSYINHYTLDGEFTGRVEKVDTSILGKYLLVYETTDSLGNLSDRHNLDSKRWVIVNDTKRPIVFNINKDRTYKEVNVTVKDATKVTATIDSEEYILGTTYNKEGKHMLIVTDEAGNYTRVPFIISTNPSNVVNGVSNIEEDIILVDQPFYNVTNNKEEVTINGNNHTITQYVTNLNLFNWTNSVPDMGDVFSSDNGSKITLNDITFKGTVHTIAFGNYRGSTYVNYNTELNNVNINNLEVLSYSANISPAIFVFGNAVFNNTNITGTKLSKYDNDPMWKTYDLGIGNYSMVTLNGGHIGSVYLFEHGKIVLKDNSVVDTIYLKRPLKSVQKIDIVLEGNAKLNKIITSTGEEITLDEFYKTLGRES